MLKKIFLVPGCVLIFSLTSCSINFHNTVELSTGLSTFNFDSLALTVTSIDGFDRDLVEGACAQLVVQSKNAGTPIATNLDLDLSDTTLGANSASLTFYSDTDCLTPVAKPKLAAGFNSATYYFKPTNEVTTVASDLSLTVNGANSALSLSTSGAANIVMRRKILDVAKGFSSLLCQVVGFSETATSGSIVCSGTSLSSSALLNVPSVAEADLSYASGEPVLLSAFGSDVTQIVVGYDSICALNTGGTVKCLGGNGTGQIGDGTNTAVTVPTLVKDIPGTGILSGVVAISGHSSTVCALLNDATVVCWGANFTGNLGGLAAYTNNLPIALAYDGTNIQQNITTLDAAYLHTCLIVTAGGNKRWKCVGANVVGQLGNSANATTSNLVDVINTNTSAVFDNIEKIANGTFHSCALTSANEIFCTGSNNVSQMGVAVAADSCQDVNSGTFNYYDKVISNCQQEAVAIAGLSGTITDIVAGHRHTCVLNSLGEVYCWGDNYELQVGSTTRGKIATPVKVASITASKLYAFEHSTCAITSEGLKCWGSLSGGHIGGGHPQYSSIPVTSQAFSSGVEDVVVWAGSLCITKGTGYCLGRVTGVLDAKSRASNYFGPYTSELVPLVDLEGATNIAKTVPTAFNLFALTTGGGIITRGYDYYGLGGTVSGQSTSIYENQYRGQWDIVRVDGSNFLDIVAGSTTACALNANGRVNCVGSGNGGALGIGSEATKATFQNVDRPSTAVVNNAVQIDGNGGSHFCLRSATGSMECWGYNHQGQIGPDAIDDCRGTPCSMQAVVITGLSTGVTDIGVGYSHNCAVKSGAVYCWGGNSQGQAGQSSATNPVVNATLVPTLASGVERVFAGFQNTCALMTNGDIKCWGANKMGQIGDGRTSRASDPVPALVTNVGATSNLKTLTIGTDAICMLVDKGATTGVMECWGSNLTGQLGQYSLSTVTDGTGIMGTANSTSVPTLVDRPID